MTKMVAKAVVVLSLVALAACGAPSANADPGAGALSAARLDPFAGVSWTVPASLELTDAYTVVCPASCKSYQGSSGETRDEWPLVVVHQPVTQSAADYLKRWRAAHLKADDYDPEIANQMSEASGQGNLTGVIAYTEDDSGRTRETSFLLLYETQGVLVPVEVAAFDQEDLESRLSDATALLESVRVDAVNAKANIAAIESGLKAQIAAIDKAYGVGKEAMLFVNTQSGVRPDYGMAGMEIQSYRDTTVYALVPGGALFTEIPDTLRKPDLNAALAENTLGSWSASGSNYAITMPDGSKKTLRRTAQGVNDGEIDLSLVDRLSAAHVPGRFESIAVSSAGGMGVGSDTFIASRADFSLLLKPDGQFEQSVSSYTSASGSAFALGTGNDDLVRGNWRYDPASYTLNLQPEGGAPPISKPFFCFGCSKADVKTANWDWFVFGEDDWWMANIERD